MFTIDMVEKKSEPQEKFTDVLSDESLDQKVRWLFFYSPCVGTPWSVAVTDLPMANVGTTD